MPKGQMTEQPVFLRFKDRLKGYSRYPKQDWILHKYLLTDTEYILLSCLRDVVVDFDYKHRYYGHFEYMPSQISYYLGWNELKVKRTFRELNRLGFFRIVYKEQNLYLLTGYGLYVQMLEKEDLKTDYFKYLDRFSTELIENLNRLGQEIPQRITDFVILVNDFIANKDFSLSISRNLYSTHYGSGFNGSNKETTRRESKDSSKDKKRSFTVGRDGMIYDEDLTDDDFKEMFDEVV